MYDHHRSRISIYGRFYNSFLFFSFHFSSFLLKCMRKFSFPFIIIQPIYTHSKSAINVFFICFEFLFVHFQSIYTMNGPSRSMREEKIFVSQNTTCICIMFIHQMSVQKATISLAFNIWFWMCMLRFFWGFDFIVLFFLKGKKCINLYEIFSQRKFKCQSKKIIKCMKKDTIIKVKSSLVYVLNS